MLRRFTGGHLVRWAQVCMYVPAEVCWLRNPGLGRGVVLAVLWHLCYWRCDYSVSNMSPGGWWSPPPSPVSNGQVNWPSDPG